MKVAATYSVPSSQITTRTVERRLRWQRVLRPNIMVALSVE